MKRFSKFKLSIFIFYVIGSLWVAALSSKYALETVHMPYVGFLPFKNLYVGAFIQPWWQGSELNLTYNDRIVAVDHRDISSIREWQDALKEKSEVEVQIQTKSQVKTASMKVNQLQPNDVLSIFGILFLTGASFLLIGLLAASIVPTPPGTGAFLVYCGSIGVYFLSAYDFHTTYHMTRFLMCSWGLVAPSIMRLAVTFPRPWKDFHKWKWLPYIVSFLLLIPYVYLFRIDPIAWKKWEYVFVFYTAIAYVFWLSVVAHRAFNREEDEFVRSQCKVMLWPLVISFGLIFVFCMMIFFGDLVVPIHWLVPLCLVFPAAILFAMFRKNLFFVDQLEHQIVERTEQLRRAEAELSQSTKLASVGLLAAGTAHEIGNAINVISANVPILGKYAEKLAKFANLGSPREEDQKEIAFIEKDLPELLTSVDRNCKRTVDIIQDLKTFARPQQQNKGDIDLVELIQATLRLLRPEFSDRIAVRTKYEKIPMLFASPGQIQQVLLNILMNAIQAISEEGTIDVEVRLQPSAVSVSVKDSGVGMSPIEQRQLFEPFYTTKKTGTGLGLSVSYGIIKAHGGNLLVESELNKGTKVTLILPVERHV